jgi:uncharacterized protein YbjT (DUF2867 family)
MQILLTGATGLIGSFLVPELINAGHHVVGLSRSDARAEALDLDRLRVAAEAADDVIYTAFNHDFSNLKREQRGRPQGHRDATIAA